MTLDLLIYGGLVGMIAWWLGRSGRVEDGLAALRAELQWRGVLPPHKDDPAALRAELQWSREEAARAERECQGLREALHAAYEELDAVKASAAPGPAVAAGEGSAIEGATAPSPNQADVADAEAAP